MLEKPAHVTRHSANGGAGRLADALGWFSIGLGVAELAAPGQMQKLIGVRDHGTLLRLLGLREIASGMGILIRPRPAGWMWSRVGGDLIDLSLLATALASDDARPKRVKAAAVAVAGVTALDVLCGRQLSRERAPARDRAIRAGKAITTGRSPEECYRFWRDYSNLPRFLESIESVEAAGERRSHWKAKGPAGITLEWDAEITDDRPNESIAWRSLPGADIGNSGWVRFERAPADRGTVVRASLEYSLPGGGIAAAAAKLRGTEPGQQLKSSLRAFKQIMETGGIVRSDASAHRGMHAGRPPEK